jgi:hypothetical protein
LLTELAYLSGNYYSLTTYTYDSNNNLLTKLYQNWDTNSWINFSLDTYTYDSSNNLLTELQQVWKGGWVNSIQHLMTYDENRNGISTECLAWVENRWQPSWNDALQLHYNNMQSIWSRQGCDKMTASYKKVSGTTAIVNSPITSELEAISIYPNPTTRELRIENGNTEIQQISVFDSAGIHLFNTQQTTIDVSHLPAGIYFVQITTEKGIVTKRVVKK